MQNPEKEKKPRVCIHRLDAYDALDTGWIKKIEWLSTSHSTVF